MMMITHSFALICIEVYAINCINLHWSLCVQKRFVFNFFLADWCIAISSFEFRNASTGTWLWHVSHEWNPTCLVRFPTSCELETSSYYCWIWKDSEILYVELLTENWVSNIFHQSMFCIVQSNIPNQPSIRRPQNISKGLHMRLEFLSTATSHSILLWIESRNCK